MRQRALRETARWTAMVLAGAMLLAGCDSLFPASEPNENVAPVAQLADNVPIAGDTLDFSLFTMHWNGGDPDGYVTAYEYRIFTSYCDGACAPVEYRDTTAGTWEGWEPVQFDDSTAWQRVNVTSRTIVFESRASFNQQVFQLRTIDNMGAVSAPSTAASRIFYTPNSLPPIVEVEEPQDGAHRFAREEPNDWWTGIDLTFTGSVNNPEKEILEYGWKVGREAEWTWTRDTSLVIAPDVFMQDGSLEGEHTIYVTARDNTNLLAHEGGGGDSVVVELVRPTFDKGLLIVDDTRENASESGFQHSDATVDSVYAAAFGSDHQWDVAREGEPPPRSVLGQYSMVVWHADNYFAASSDAPAIADYTDVVSDYLVTGGDLILSGAHLVFTIGGSAVSPPRTPSTGDDVPFDEEDHPFIRRFLHIASYDATITIPFPAEQLLVGALGLGDFSDVSVAPDKLPGGFPFVGNLRSGEEVAGLPRVNVISRRGSFTEPIYTFEGAGPSNWNRQTVGIKYYGTVFDVAFFGFPLWFLENDDIDTLADELLSSFNEQ